jgi:hypothetical protein
LICRNYLKHFFDWDAVEIGKGTRWNWSYGGYLEVTFRQLQEKRADVEIGNPLKCIRLSRNDLRFMKEDNI